MCRTCGEPQCGWACACRGSLKDKRRNGSRTRKVTLEKRARRVPVVE